MCPDWRDPRNVGSTFRLADAAGLAGLVLGGASPTPPNPKISKTARSTVRSVPYTVTTDTAAFLTEARERGELVLALEITDGSQSLLDYQLPAETIAGQQAVYLIAGTEAGGIDQPILDLCHASVHLPMFGQNTSMNVAVAMGAAVYLLLAQLR